MHIFFFAFRHMTTKNYCIGSFFTEYTIKLGKMTPYFVNLSKKYLPCYVESSKQ
jgi:hypothetical protein